MNVKFNECQVVTFRRGAGFVTLSCHLHLVDIFSLDTPRSVRNAAMEVLKINVTEQ